MLARRIGMSLFGVVICAICVGFFKLAAFGVDPFQSLMAGLDQWIPISFGTLYVIVNAVLLLFALFADRSKIGIATFINLFLLGYITDFTYKTLQTWMPDPSMAVRVICIIGAIVVICFGSAFYMTANLGVSTYDAVAIVMSEKWHMGKFKYIRICTDIVCVILGIACFMIGGGKASAIPTFVGVGTIITAFFMGPLVDFFNRKVAIPFMNGKKA